MTLGAYRWLRPSGRRSAKEIAAEFSTALLRGLIRDEAVRVESPLGVRTASVQQGNSDRAIKCSIDPATPRLWPRSAGLSNAGRAFQELVEELELVGEDALEGVADIDLEMPFRIQLDLAAGRRRRIAAGRDGGATESVSQTQNRIGQGTFAASRPGRYGKSFRPMRAATSLRSSHAVGHQPQKAGVGVRGVHQRDLARPAGGPDHHRGPAEPGTDQIAHRQTP